MSSRTQMLSGKARYQKMTLAVSRKLRRLHQNKGVKGKDLVKRYPQYCKTCIYDHMVKPIGDNEGDKRKRNPGRPKFLPCAQKMFPQNDTRKHKKSYRRIPLDVSIHMRYLHQDLHLSGKEVVKRYRKYSQSSVYKHMLKPIGDNVEDHRKDNPGRPPRLSQRGTRRILNKVQVLRKDTEGDFTVDDVKKAADISDNISNQTVSRILWKEGYGLRNKRRKGVLTANDIKVRLKFAKYAKKTLSKDIWCKQISFYLDGAGFTHKFNPCKNARRRSTMTWRKRSEGLSLYCTSAGSHEGSGGRVAKFMVAIAYEKGVTMCEEFKDRLNGTSFADFVRKHFPPCFNRSVNPQVKLFLQDGDPSQNSALAMEALGEICGKKFSIPPRSPDLNPIENLFLLTKRKLKADALANEITQENYNDFVTRIQRTMIQTPTKVIDNIIASMNKRIDMVIKSKGQRIKY